MKAEFAKCGAACNSRCSVTLHQVCSLYNGGSLQVEQQLAGQNIECSRSVREATGAEGCSRKALRVHAKDALLSDRVQTCVACADWLRKQPISSCDADRQVMRRAAD
jgi:hypothetical protein